MLTKPFGNAATFCYFYSFVSHAFLLVGVQFEWEPSTPPPPSAPPAPSRAQQCTRRRRRRSRGSRHSYPALNTNTQDNENFSGWEAIFTPYVLNYG